MYIACRKTLRDSAESLLLFFFKASLSFLDLKRRTSYQNLEAVSPVVKGVPKEGCNLLLSGLQGGTQSLSLLLPLLDLPLTMGQGNPMRSSQHESTF